MNQQTHHVFAAPERLRALRLELATSRRARHVNLSVLVRQHEEKLRNAATRCDKSARVAIHRLIDVVAADARWTLTTRRDLRAAVRGVSAAVSRLSHASVADEIAWLRDRLREIEAQDARISALDAVVAAHWPDTAGQFPPQQQVPRRRG